MVVFAHAKGQRSGACGDDPSTAQGKEYVTHLLRRSYREAGKVKNETVANISCLPSATVELLRRSLRGERLVGADELFKIERSRPHGHVAAVTAMARKVGMADLLGPACRQRDIAFALIVARACRPGSKLATVRWWADTTLAPDSVLPAVTPTMCTQRWTGW